MAGEQSNPINLILKYLAGFGGITNTERNDFCMSRFFSKDRLFKPLTCHSCSLKHVDFAIL